MQDLAGRIGDWGPHLQGWGWGAAISQREDMKEEQAVVGTGGTVAGG